MEKIYYLIQWEDRYMSVIEPESIISPKKDQYSEGELVRAWFKTKSKKKDKDYEAVVCEIHSNLTYLKEQAKLPPKYNYQTVKMQQNSHIHGLENLLTQDKAGVEILPTCPSQESVLNKPPTENLLTQDKGAEKSPTSPSQGSVLNKPTTETTCLETERTPLQSHHTEHITETPRRVIQGISGPRQIHNAEQTTETPQNDIDGTPDGRHNEEETTGMQLSGHKRCKERSDELKEEIRSLRRKLRRLEERMAAWESNVPAEPTQDLLAEVSHLQGSDVQQVFTKLTHHVFSEGELTSCSRTGKKTVKCTDGQPRPPLDVERLVRLERAVMTKTGMERKVFCAKLENLQKTLRQKASKKK